MAERLIIRFVREISQKSSNNRSIIKIIERNDLATGFQFDGGVIYRIPVALAAVHSISRKLGRETKSREDEL